ncbi:MAG: vanadium-dependent haloperoxidase [Akkermansiaceae bacterium]|nr:vanadium-dependent haloperoxidase [Akkermansiaceae bacterium]
MQIKAYPTAKRMMIPLIGLLVTSSLTPAKTVVRMWNEENLAAIRIDFPAPTVHARNLFHLSAAMWDAWAAYETEAIGYLHNENADVPDGSTLREAREEAISYAAYRILKHRYSFSTKASTTLPALDDLMAGLGYDAAKTSATGESPDVVGNRIAASIISYGAGDGANESTDPGYRDDTGYSPVNSPLILATNDTASSYPNGWSDLNRWQPLAFSVAFTQNGQIASKIQQFVSPHWGSVKGFGLFSFDLSSNGLYFDPGEPPKLGETGDLDCKNNAVEVLEYSAVLDPADPTTINLSPSVRGNNPLGTNDGSGHVVNPVTGAPYPDNIVLHADFGRCVAEFWADGPGSETPPGHWNVLANDVTDTILDDPSLELRIANTGPVLETMEWELKLYLALNAALHNTAVAVWGVKEHYDYVRPISAIRYLGYNGELPIVPGLAEKITAGTIGSYHSHLSGHLGEIAVHAWPGEPDNPETQVGGREWILAKEWLPYQQDTFVTPAFAGYVSGHSGFSRAAAEIMTLITGTPFFPGGISSYTIPAGDLQFEAGPTTDMTLQWATYYDAADEAGESRIYGGIHVSPDDGPGRIMGAEIGQAAFTHAQKYWDGSIIRNTPVTLKANGELIYQTIPGYHYTLESGTDLVSFPVIEATPGIATGHEQTLVVPLVDPSRFFQMRITAP